jgi:hypothetical protein
MASFSDYYENSVLDTLFGSTTYLALCTTVPTDASTGATLVECDYTGYARKAILSTDMGDASSGAITNTNAITFDACTGGTPDDVVGWAVCDNASTGAGNVLVWGTCTSTTISTTQTPATVAVGGLDVTLD